MTTLKGRVENIKVKYIWVSNGGCDACEELDGEEFESADDIPDRPHPNCQCYVEVVELEDEEDDEGHGHGGNGGGENDEPCDCPEQAEALLEELEEIAGDAESLTGEVEVEIDDIEGIVSEAENTLAEINETLEVLKDEYGQHLPDCKNCIDDLYEETCVRKSKLEILIRDILNILPPLYTWIAGIVTFVSEVWQLWQEEDGSLDKYYHATANCTQAQIGEFGDKVAEKLSDFREFTRDYEYLSKSKKLDMEELEKSHAQHQEVNRLGRERGRTNPDCDCKTLNWDVRDYHKKEDWKHW